MYRFLRCLGVYLALSGCHLAFAQGVPAEYDQPFRPHVHFSPKQHWTNDPNGLVFFEGEYHLFYQYNPSGDTWGHMSWGHAVSRDLLYWQELPVAIPEHDGEMIFTGSVVVDERNTSGFCKSGVPCLVAVYTSHRNTGEHTQTETHSIAYSVDRGRTWKFYDHNPVLDLNKSDFRDPGAVSYTHLRAHETRHDLVCRLLL